MALARSRHSGRYVFFGLAALSLVMFSIDSTVVAVAIPPMTRDFQTSLSWIGWTLTAYMLAQTVMMPFSGKLSERFGRMRVFLASVGLFTLGSLLCGAAPNIYLLILFRVLQAAGGGGILPSAVGIVAEEFPDNRDRMLGLFTSIFPIGGVIGPNLGGLIVEHASWRAVFFINVPIGLLVLAVLAPRLRQPEKTARRPIDLFGTFLYAGAIVALLTAMSLLGDDTRFWRTPYFWALIAGCAALLTAFIRQERRAPEPVIDLGLVGRNPFLAVNLYNFLFGACAFGFFSFIPFFAVTEYHMGTAESGAILTPRSLAMMGASFFASMFLIRLGYRRPMILGLLAIAGSLALLSVGPGEVSLGGLHLGPFWVMGAEVALAGLGMGMAGPASNNAALDLVPGRAAIITGIRGLFRSTGGVIGTALIVLGVEFSPDRAAGLRAIFAVLAIVLLLTIGLIFLIPDTARTRHLARKRAAAGGEVREARQPAGMPADRR